MNRQERRNMNRKIEKDKKFLSKLSKEDIFKMNDMLKSITENQSKMYFDMVDRNLSAILVEEGYTFKEISNLMDRMADYMLEDDKKIKKLESENVDMSKLQEDTKKYMVELIKENVSKKEVINKTLFKFPQLSRTAVSNAYGRIEEEIEIENAAEYVLEESVAQNVVEEKIKKKKVEPKEEPKKKSKLKVTETVKKAKGEYNAYIISNEKVTFGDVEIKNLQDLDKYKARLEEENGKAIEEFIKKLTSEADSEINEIIEAMEMM